MARPRIVVVGGGFAGLQCLRRLERRLRPTEAELVLVSPFSYMLYLPLLPHVAAGVVTPQSIAVSLRRMLVRTRIVPGGAVGIDLKARAVVVRTITGQMQVEHYDRLVVAPGSVTRAFDIPGLTQYGRGMKTLAQAVYLRDHVLAQLELAANSTDRAEQAARCQFVVVGGGYAGAETAACLQRLTTAALEKYPRLDPSLVNWTLVDVAPKIMPELGENLGRSALRLLRERGIEVALETGVAEVTDDTVRLTDGRTLPCRTLIWTAGVTPSPLVGTMDVETVRGRVAVGADLAVPGQQGVFALGDAASVPDLVKGDGAVCPPTAQHAQRQGKVVAENVVASLHGDPMREYRHKDLGLVVDLGGAEAVSNPLGREMTGLPAQLVARGYHLMALPSVPARYRTLANWMLNLTAGDDFVRMGFLATRQGSLVDFEHTDQYLSKDEVHAQVEALDARIGG
ncbi:NAD(P)/FAD-dependent oxidoreductase [Allostreptomyces psammosilenae]|uniref:NADH dehydrogenase n=1 Tax=Allostreptomyces psammosilenae TaxID=1892865 RepID=A0A852ZQQ6_9ACTN|nr:NAD(P)/FAD-dependent oxidoreductase [Allostreptomyces psammosilenae]NYI03194.1 NADH dehydrogenase [Allostreptomyces psammosilenae]